MTSPDIGSIALKATLPLLMHQPFSPKVIQFTELEQVAGDKDSEHVVATHPVCPIVHDWILEPVDHTEHSPAVEQLCVQ